MAPPRRGRGQSPATAARVADSEDARLHREAEAGVRLKAQRLRRALDTDRLDDAVRGAADVAAQLRSPAAADLSPKAYYDVYLGVASELRLLEMYIAELARRGKPVLEIYERVQETPLVLPRLYLLITAGSVYVKSLQAPARDVLRDLVEMCAGVQHPQRGLFLRAYLAQMMKDKLPDVGNAYCSPAHSDGASSDSSAQGDVRDSVDFIIRNFTEMNRLWVRMQHDCAPPDLPRRQKERLELRLLVGSNISTLARLEGVDLPMYKATVLPAVLDQIVSCHDAIAQEYLADCIAQVFPDNFQLATLHDFLAMCSQLVRGVNLRTILVSVIDRLTRYASQNEDNAAEVVASSAFLTFRRHIQPVIARQRASLSVADRIHVFLSLMRFTLKSQPDALGYVDDVLGFAVDLARELSSGKSAADTGDGAAAGDEASDLSTAANDGGSGGGGSGGDISGSKSGVAASEGPTIPSPLASEPYSAAKQSGSANLNAGIPATDHLFSAEEEDLLVRLLTLPLETHRSISAALTLTNYGALQEFLQYRTRRKLAVTLLRSVDSYKPCITKVIMLHKLFDYVGCLAQDQPRIGPDGLPLEMANDQNSLANDCTFDVSGLSPHHDYILASVPGATSFVTPMESLNGIGTGGGDSGDNDHGDAEDSGASDGEMDGRDFEQGQELVARIVFLCSDADLIDAFAMHVALRDRLMRGGRRRVPTTLPPLVLATLRICARAGESAASLVAMSDGSSGFDLARQGLHFAVETVDVLRLISPGSALRLNLQTAIAAAGVYARVRELEGIDANDVQQYVHENISRAFQVYEESIVTGKTQFVALDLIIGTLVGVRRSLDPDVLETLTRRTVKHARRLLTRSDQCLALCACAYLFWTPVFKKDKGKRKGYIFDKPGDGNLSGSGGGDGDAVLNDSQGVVLCVDAALDAARGCVNTGERVLLLVDVGHRLVLLQEVGFLQVVSEGTSCKRDESQLGAVIRAARTALDARPAASKSSVVGRAAATRLHRLCKYVKAQHL
jgi:Vacuolar protein sorting-associated protein 35